MLDERFNNQLPIFSGRTNTGIIPESCPGDLFELRTPAFEITQSFADLCLLQRAAPIEPWDLTASEVLANIQDHLKERFAAYRQAVGSKTLQIRLEDSAKSSDDSLLALYDISDRFFSILPSQKRGGEAALSAQYEIFESPVKLLAVAQARHFGGEQGFAGYKIEFVPLVSKEAYSEMIGHLEDLSTYLGSMPANYDIAARKIPVASYLFDLMLDLAESHIAYHSRLGCRAHSQISRPLELKMPGENSFNLFARVTDHLQSAGGAEFSSSRIEVFPFFGALNRFNTPIIDWRQDKAAAQIGDRMAA